MDRNIIFFILLFFLTNCSVDTKSGFWENKKKPVKSKKISNIKFTKDLTYEQFKENAIQYGKFSEFPKLDK